MQIHPICLSIRPAYLEREFWNQRHVVGHLLNIDRFAFVMSTLNIYSGWKAAGAMVSAPAACRTMQALCIVFFLLSALQQLLMRQHPAWYVRHRQTIITATRLVRGGWMVTMFFICNEADIRGYFVSRKLESSASQELVVLQLLLMLSLIFLAQCLIWPLPFKRALPLQLLYILSAVLSMNNVKCIVNYPELAAGTLRLCYSIRFAIDVLSAALSGCHMVAAVGAAATPGSSSDNSNNLGQAVNSDRCAEEVVYFTIWTCGLLLPLYIIYARELVQKQQFLRLKRRQLQHQPDDVAELLAHGQQQQQRRQRPELGYVLNLAPLLHAAVFALLLITSSMCCQLLLRALPAPVCAVLPPTSS